MARVLPWLIVAATTLLLASIKSNTALKMARPGCRETCGNLTIPYPFGIGPGCYYKQGFDVSCEDNRTFMPNSSSRIQMYNINLLGGQVQVSTLIASKCNYTNGESTDGWVSVFTTPFFTLSSKANRLTAIGCNTVAFLGGYNKHRAQTGCVSLCLDKRSVDFSGQCSGMGCCQTAIAPNLGSLNITFDKGFNNYVVNDFNPCSYAFVAEQDWFRFEASYLQDKKLTDKYKDGVPSVFDWVAGNQPCDEAVKNISSYACISRNSQCFNSPNATGYLYSCSVGFEGNPYLADGCQDIDECQHPLQYPCYGICSNTVGGYSCSCAAGTRSKDPKTSVCSPDAASERAKLTKLLIGNYLYSKNFSTVIRMAWISHSDAADISRH